MLQVNIHEHYPTIEVPKCDPVETFDLRPAAPFEEEIGTSVSYEGDGLCDDCKDNSPRGLRPGKDIASGEDMNEIASNLKVWQSVNLHLHKQF